MANVYGQVEQFYKKNRKAAELLPRRIVESSLRRDAWRGKHEDELQREWNVISFILGYMKDMELSALDELTPYDYLDMLYLYAASDPSFALNEPDVKWFLKIWERVLNRQARDGHPDDCRYALHEAKALMYDENGQFSLPDHMVFTEGEGEDGESEEAFTEGINDLLQQASDIFRGKAYETDLNRALDRYLGPDNEAYQQETSTPEKRDTFGFNFWDYFLFDYHLAALDLTPLSYLVKHKVGRFKEDEWEILRELSEASFHLLVIESFLEDMMLCRDLMTGEHIELPPPEFPIDDHQAVLLYGHIYTDHDIVLNYINMLPASQRRQRQIRRSVQQQYQLFRCQQPGASWKTFFKREAVVVRHICRIVNRGRIPASRQALPVIRTRYTGNGTSDRDLRMLHHLGCEVGYSTYAAGLLVQLARDYLSRLPEPPTGEQRVQILASSLLLFAEVNGVDLSGIPDIYALFYLKKEDVLQRVADMRAKLDCQSGDPRYLTEDGFVTALYASDRKGGRNHDGRRE